MANELSLISAEKVTATIEVHVRRILSITAAYYGLAPAQGVGLNVGGGQRGRGSWSRPMND